jgi:hypothetical protein
MLRAEQHACDIEGARSVRNELQPLDAGTDCGPAERAARKMGKPDDEC